MPQIPMKERQRIAAKLREKGWTVTELARRAGLHRSALSLAISGAEHASDERRGRILRALGLPLESEEWRAALKESERRVGRGRPPRTLSVQPSQRSGG